MNSYKIPKSLKEKTWDWLQDHSMGHRFDANGSKAEQFVGLLGENMFRMINDLPPKFVKGFDGGYDLIFMGQKTDVKTMGRRVDPKPHYVNNFVGYQKDFDCDLYVFCSINKSTNTFWICGYTDKQTLLTESNFYEKGERRYRDDGSYFINKAPLYEIENTKLNPLII